MNNQGNFALIDLNISQNVMRILLNLTYVLKQKKYVENTNQTNSQKL